MRRARLLYSASSPDVPVVRLTRAELPGRRTWETSESRRTTNLGGSTLKLRGARTVCRYNSLAFSGSFVGNVSFAMRLLIKDQDATRDALDRMSERIERLEGKRQVVQNDQVYQ